jgi:hypothetical protein
MQGREEGRDAVSAARASVKKEQPSNLSPISFICADAHKEVGIVKDLYDSLLEAKQKCGEPTDGLSFPQFHASALQLPPAVTPPHSRWSSGPFAHCELTSEARKYPHAQSLSDGARRLNHAAGGLRLSATTGRQTARAAD